MKKRFSSLNVKDVAAWLMAIGVFAGLAGAGFMIGLLHGAELPHASRPI